MSDVVVQRACNDYAPDDALLMEWAESVLTQFEHPGEVTVRIVDAAEMQSLNHTYRQKNALTNVLSFAVDDDIRTLHGLLGDIVICPAVVEQEAREQGKPRDAHFAHLIVHGTLHLLGYDHIEDSDAETMEAMETATLATLGINDPYRVRATNTL